VPGRRFDALPSFEPAARLRPVALVRAGTSLPPAPYAAVERDLADSAATVSLSSGDTTLMAGWDGERVSITITVGSATSHHISRRHATTQDPSALALSLTGPHVSAYVLEAGAWVARAIVDLAATHPILDVHDESWLADLVSDGDRAGTFGGLGLRDLRLVTNADGSPYAVGERLFLTATSAGPGGFRTSHTSVWSLDPVGLGFEHRADLFFRRPEIFEHHGVYGDHATHLLRDGARWLVATSTWGDFDRHKNPRVTTILATTSADVLSGCHVLDTEPLVLPGGPTSVGTWDPHLVRTDSGWLATFVSASRFFRFHPVIAEGSELTDLTHRAAATDRIACEGPTLAHLDGAWRVLASDGRDEQRGRRASYPVFDLDLHELGTLDADYPTNLPWPTLVPTGGEWLLIGFDGTRYGGPLLGYGTHGDLVVQRST